MEKAADTEPRAPITVLDVPPYFVRARDRTGC